MDSVPEGLKTSQRNEKGRRVPADEVYALEFSRYLGYGGSYNGLVVLSIAN